MPPLSQASTGAEGTLRQAFSIHQLVKWVQPRKRKAKRGSGEKGEGKKGLLADFQTDASGIPLSKMNGVESMAYGSSEKITCASEE